MWRQRAAGNLSFIDAAKDDGSTGKNRLCVVEQEIKCRAHHGDGQVDLLVGIFGLEKVPQTRSVIGRPEPGEIHSLVIDLEAISKVRRERILETGFDGR